MDLGIYTDNIYGLHSTFNIKKHKETFDHYLEVIILKDGTVVYEVPSHSLKATALAQEKINKKHVATLRKLKINGLYTGVIPEVGAQERGWL